MDIELNKKACAGHAQARDVIRRMPVHPISTNISLFAYAGRRTPSLCENTGTYKSHVHGIRILSKKSILPEICFFNFTNTSTFFPTSLETSSQLYFPRVGIVHKKRSTVMWRTYFTSHPILDIHIRVWTASGPLEHFVLPSCRKICDKH